MRAASGSEYLLHAEIANNNQNDMPLRMLRYYTDIRLAGHQGPIRQVLIYIGTDPLNMRDGIDEPELLDYRYRLVDMHQVNCTGLLVQDDPDALVLAVLCDFGERAPQEVVNYIVRRLSDLTGTDEKRFREYMTMLEILSENRNLKSQVEEAERMLTQIEIERMPSYIIGMERGDAIAKRDMVRRLLSRMDLGELADLLDLRPEEVTHIAAEDDATEPKE